MDELDYLMQEGSESVSGTFIGADAPQGLRKGRGSFRRLIAAGTATTVGAGATADIAAVVSQPFKASRMYVNAAIATALYTVNNIRIATFSLNVTNNALPIDMFLRDSVGVDLVGYTAQPGVGLTVSVTNPSGGGVLTNLGFIGWAHVEG